MKKYFLDKEHSQDIISALFYLILGILMRHFLKEFLTYAYYLNIILLMAGGVRCLYTHFSGRGKESLTEGIINIILGIILITKPFSMIYIIQFGCSSYYILLAIIHITAFIQRLKDSAGLRIGLLIISCFEIMIAYELFFGRNNSVYYLARILGLYFIVYSLSIFVDMILSVISTKDRKKTKIHLSLPNIICAFVPKKVLLSINKMLREDKSTSELINKQKSGEYQLEVFIHMADTLFGQVGHVDLCYADNVISYGSYDESSYRFNGMLGDGVVEIVDRNKYIRFCLEVANKHIVSFGVRLTREEETKLQKKLMDIYDNLIPWNPPIKNNENGGNLLKTAQYELDYASSLYEKTNARFYKFKDGKYSRFKTYFGLFTNCATLAREITSHIGLNLFDFSGIISPGTFYDYLNGEYKRANSFVTSRNLYAHPDNVK